MPKKAGSADPVQGSLKAKPPFGVEHVAVGDVSGAGLDCRVSYYEGIARVREERGAHFGHA